MSITNIASVFCDGPYCAEWIGQDFGAREARKVAKRMGWKRRRVGTKTLDLCPDCAKKPSAGGDDD